MESQRRNNNLSNHILPASANLLGICFIILSFIKVDQRSRLSTLDEMILLPIILFFSSCLFSYFSLRRHAFSKAIQLNEKIADGLFLCGLLSLTVISIAFFFEVIN